MPSKVDPAILKALAVDAASISQGSSGFSSTCTLTTTVNGKTKRYFLKTSQKDDDGEMFAGEHESLNAIQSVVPSLCPQSIAHGPLSSSQGSFLLTQYINFSSRASNISHTLSQKLAKLHTTPAPIPEGFSVPQFGFAVPTYCGSTRQDNSFTSSWAEFYATRRLIPILKAGENRNGTNSELSSLVHRTVDEVVPRLLGEGHLKSGEPGREGKPIRPVVVHGDLWSGNKSTGVIEIGDETTKAEEMIYDPCACYAHSEYEWGIMRMFGGFGGAFQRDYLEIRGKDKPEEEWEDRLELYELYHQMNHYAIFGGWYRSSAVSIMKRLLKKYGPR